MIEYIDLELEEWRGDDYTRQFPQVDSASDLDELIQRIGSFKSSMLSIKHAEKILIVAASSNVYTVTAILDSDNILDIITENCADGVIHFLEGGQSIDLPRCNAVSFKDVVLAVREFLTSCSLSSHVVWKKQS